MREEVKPRAPFPGGDYQGLHADVQQDLSGRWWALPLFVSVVLGACFALWAWRGGLI